MRNEQEIIAHCINIFNKENNIRAAILTSSRTKTNGYIDFLSDYDIELYVNILDPFIESDSWIKEFGNKMICWPMQPRATFDEKWITRLVYFEDYTRIDFQITEQKELEDSRYVNGFKVLVDKDNLTANISFPTYSKYNTKIPSAQDYKNNINDFWWDALYVPKCLYRNELPFAKYMFHDLIFNHLHKVIEWYIGMNNEWSVNIGVGGKYFEKYLDVEVWKRYKMIYTDGEIDNNWNAFYKTVSLFSDLAKIVGNKLNFQYPIELEDKVVSLCSFIESKKNDK